MGTRVCNTYHRSFRFFSPRHLVCGLDFSLNAYDHYAENALCLIVVKIYYALGLVRLANSHVDIVKRRRPVLPLTPFSIFLQVRCSVFLGLFLPGQPRTQLLPHAVNRFW